jgi:hypothetical protein
VLAGVEQQVESGDVLLATARLIVLRRHADLELPPLYVRLLPLRVAVGDKPSGYLRFAALATKPGEKSGLTPVCHIYVRGFCLDQP